MSESNQLNQEYDKPNKLDGFESCGNYWVVLANQSGQFLPVWRKNGLKAVMMGNKLIYVHWMEYSNQMGAYWQTNPQPV